MPVSLDADIPTFKIPKLTPHKDYPYVKKETDEYLSTFARESKSQASYDYPLFFALSYNFAISAERFLYLTLINTLLFVIDDEIEFLGKTDLNGLEKYITEVTYYFQYPNRKTNETALSKAIISVSTKILEKLDAKQANVFTNTIIDYFKINLFMFQNIKSKNQFIGVDNLILYRRVDCCVLQMAILVEYALDYNVDRELPNSPYIQEMKILAIDHIMISNDIIGAKVEYAKHEMMSYVLANFYEHKCSLQQAIDKAYKYFQDTDKRMLNLADFIKNNEKMVRQSPRVIEYVDAMIVMCYGHIQWTLETKRHHLSPKLIENSSINKTWIKHNNDPSIDELIGPNINYYVLNSEE